MNRNSIIKLILALGTSAGVFFLTHFLGNILLMHISGNTVYAVSAPLMLPLQIIATLVTLSIFAAGTNEKIDHDFSEDNENDFVSNVTEHIEHEDADMSEYPEFAEKTARDIPDQAFTRPDIKEFISRQKCEIDTNDTESAEKAESEKDDFLKSFLRQPDQENDINSVYDNIPAELPEDYTPYEEDETEEAEEEYDDDPYEIRISPVMIRLAAAAVCVLLAIFLPSNFCTVFSPDKVTVRRPFSQKEYTIGNCKEYTVGVKLSGDISMEAHFDDGKSFDLIIPAYALKSQAFKENYSSTYEYAAFCDRLMKEKGIRKNIDGLNSFVISPALSEKDISYIEEITETNFTTDNY